MSNEHHHKSEIFRALRRLGNVGNQAHKPFTAKVQHTSQKAPGCVMANQWFRMYSEFAHDPKVQMMSEAMQRRYVMLLCLRCSNSLVTLQEAEIAFHLRISDSELVETKQLFIAKGFIDEQWNVPNWDKRQFKSDSSAERVAKHRANKKEAVTQGVTLHVTKSNALEQNRTDTDKNPSPTALPAAAEETPAAADPLSCPIEKIVELYHQHMPNNPRLRILNDKRRATIRQRWREAARMDAAPFGFTSQADGLNAWAEFFKVCADSDFLTGRVPPAAGRLPFVADLDFLMSPSGFVKCLENKYHREIA